MELPRQWTQQVINKRSKMYVLTVKFLETSAKVTVKAERGTGSVCWVGRIFETVPRKTSPVRGH